MTGRKGLVRGVPTIELEHEGRTVLNQAQAAEASGMSVENFKAKRRRGTLGIEPAGTNAGLVYFYADELHHVGAR